MRPRNYQRQEQGVHSHPEVVAVVRQVAVEAAHYWEVEVRNHIQPAHTQKQDTTHC